MAFDLSAARIAWIPVQWPGIAQEGDALAKPIQHEIECLVEFLDRDELEALGLLNMDGTTATRLERNLEVFKRLTRDWRKVQDNGVAIPMKDENIARMLGVPMFEIGFCMSYLRAWAGAPEVREKNFDASEETGPEAEPKKPSQTSLNGNARPGA